MGKGLLCVECAAEGEGHCPECGGCYFEIQGWCEECLRCVECIPTCEYCSTEEGAILCVECATDAGMHCPDCSECYGEANGELCEECGICGVCADICSTHELCIVCAIDSGYHCPGCEACGEDEVICEECGEKCSGCANEFCENCNLCDECVQLCPGCGACSQCAEICENCGEYCSECEGICDDCGLCLVCCEDFANFEGCDCSDWVCIENDNWNEHFEESHTVSDSGHSARPSAAWLWDNTYHWHACAYCEDSAHYTSMGKHSYSNGICTVCGHVKDAKIIIVEQPKDTKNVYVASPDEMYDERNIAHLSVKAVGNSELTYTWCRRYYVGGQITYKPLSELFDPEEGEIFDGPNLSVVVPTDACCNPWYICCIITDEDGNEVRTSEALLQARHDYQYYSCWKEDHEWPLPSASRNKYGHILQCVGECCDEQVTNLRPHVDDNRDEYCDICDYEISGILITKQPKSVKNVYVRSDDEIFDESNIAHFSVEAVGESELTYTWCRGYYSGGRWVYRPLSECWADPGEGENFDGPNLDIAAPEDACCTTYTFCCFITDEDGNELNTVNVELRAKHNYQYFKDYLSTCERPYEYAKRYPNGHILQCIGTGCEKKTKLRHHVDEDKNYRCDICDYRSVIDLVELTITAPKEGQLPNYAVGCGSTAYWAMGAMNNGRYWYVSDNGVDNWKLIDNTTPFVADKYYKFSVDLCTASGYEFDRHYSYNSKVLVKVNGGSGFFAQKTYNQDLAHYVTVEWVFGICNDSVIENIVIDNVTQPVVGEKPTYSATARGSGYRVDTDRNAYYEEYVGQNAGKKYYYIKNGIGWFDLTEWDWVYENETFIPGHEYQVRVYLKTEDGYTFWHDKWYDMLFTATVNGQSATGNATTSNGLYEQTISATFPCSPATVSAVAVSGIDAPVAGKTPDYTGQVGNATLYSFAKYGYGNAGFWWYDCEGNALSDQDKFVAGETYSLEIKLTNTMVGQAVASKFQTPVTAKLNGKTVDSSDVMANSTTVYIYQTYTCNVASVSGSITSFNDASGDVTLQLIEQGLPEPAYETIVKGNTAEYSFSGVAKGTYTLRVSKANHVTREYTVVVGDKSVTMDVKLCLKGDATGDGKVNMKDWNCLYEHLNEVSELTGYEWQCADATGDGKVNMKDWNRLYEHLNEVNPL
ncbi:MAG: hypothetical protein E7466_06935 [Ruminococcaceae bacterium]|nr:hypothetical protein [Oscillospiraceae bacterium]